MSTAAAESCIEISRDLSSVDYNQNVQLRPKIDYPTVILIREFYSYLKLTAYPN